MDPEFLAALPEELQQEVLESRRREIQARRSARERAEAQRVRQRTALTKAVALNSCTLLHTFTAMVIPEQCRASKSWHALLEQLQLFVCHSQIRGVGAALKGICRLQAAAGSGSAAEARPTELDLATTIASFPPEVREEVLLGASENILSQLPPAILAEAQALRQRSPRLRHCCC